MSLRAPRRAPDAQELEQSGGRACAAPHADPARPRPERGELQEQGRGAPATSSVESRVERPSVLRFGVDRRRGRQADREPESAPLHCRRIPAALARVGGTSGTPSLPLRRRECQGQRACRCRRRIPAALARAGLPWATLKLDAVIRGDSLCARLCSLLARETDLRYTLPSVS